MAPAHRYDQFCANLPYGPSMSPMQMASHTPPIAIDNVHVLFLSCAMWTATQDLRFCVKIGLRKGLGRIRGLRRALTDDEQDTVAKGDRRAFKSSWKIESDESFPLLFRSP
jgi:hypothetical protein